MVGERQMGVPVSQGVSAAACEAGEVVTVTGFAPKLLMVVLAIVSLFHPGGYPVGSRSSVPWRRLGSSRTLIHSSDDLLRPPPVHKGPGSSLVVRCAQRLKRRVENHQRVFNFAEGPEASHRYAFARTAVMNSSV